MHPKIRSAARRGSLMIELTVAIGLLVGALFPLAYSISLEKRAARAAYLRAVAMEIVDGEIETLAAGERRDFAFGTHEFPVRAASAVNLPPGKFLLTITTNRLRLEWRPAIAQHGGPVVREVALR